MTAIATPSPCALGMFKHSTKLHNTFRHLTLLDCTPLIYLRMGKSNLTFRPLSSPANTHARKTHSHIGPHDRHKGRYVVSLGSSQSWMIRQILSLLLTFCQAQLNALYLSLKKLNHRCLPREGLFKTLNPGLNNVQLPFQIIHGALVPCLAILQPNNR